MLLSKYMHLDKDHTPLTNPSALLLLLYFHCSLWLPSSAERVQKVLWDLVISKWAGDGCKEYEDTLKVLAGNDGRQ